MVWFRALLGHASIRTTATYAVAGTATTADAMQMTASVEDPMQTCSGPAALRGANAAPQARRAARERACVSPLVHLPAMPAAADPSPGLVLEAVDVGLVRDRLDGEHETFVSGDVSDAVQEVHANCPGCGTIGVRVQVHPGEVAHCSYFGTPLK